MVRLYSRSMYYLCLKVVWVSSFLLIICKVQAQAIVAAHSTASPSSVSAATLQLTQLLSAYRSYQADFNQMTYDRSGKILQHSQGHVKIVRPGRFRWEIDNPSRQLMIANGNQLWIYDIDLQQVTRQTLQQQGLSPAVLLSSSVTDLAQQFTIRAQSKQWFELIPKQSSDLFPVVRLQFVAGRLVALQMVNALGQNNLFYFHHIIINQVVSPAWFQFTPPRGVDVLST